MAQIKLLPDNVINQIAAGEVIERPSSAVKELVENSLDAGATDVKISIKRGGKEFIRIQDNGCGMDESNLSMCVLRHATSKLKDAEDLFRLSTNGFRGEALASIAAISRLTLESREQSAEVGYKIDFEGGVQKIKEEIAVPCGTVISVSDLFFNAPVRIEFLKSDSAENLRILDIVGRIAIANPDVRFELKIDNKVQLQTSAGTQLSRITDILGASVARSLKEVNWQEAGIYVKGLVSCPEDLQPGKRNIPYIYLQKRPIYNGIISKAISQAYSVYGNLSPVAILFLDMPLQDFDVNVHPAKREVRFSRDHAVYLAVYHAVCNALQTAISYPSISISGLSNSVYSEEVAENKPVYTAPNNNLNEFNELFPKENESKEKIIPFEQPVNTLFDNEEKTERKENLNCLQIEKSFIVCENGLSILFIDQNAAHKRILYEQALESLNNNSKIDSQELLFPEIVETPPRLSFILEEQKAELAKLGFHFEPFGPNTWQVRGVPLHLPLNRVKRAIIDFLESFDGENKKTGIFERTARAWANSSAIAKGTELSSTEMSAIVSELLSSQNPYESPSGKPVFMRMPIEDIKRKFN